MRRLLGWAALAAPFAVTAFLACTEDPRAGQRSGPGGQTNNAGASSSSGGLDSGAVDGPVACGNAPGAAAPFTKQALLSAAADCAAWHACTFQNAATALRTALRAWDASKTDATLAEARTAWRAAMDEWSSMELFQFGPVGSTSIDKYHGRGLRTFVHPWPATSRCEAEKQIALKEWQTRGVGAVLPGGRGLFSIEYALFYPGADTACLAASPTGQAYAGFSAADLTAAKSSYASAVGDNLVALALEIRNVWLPEGENFKAKLLAFDEYGSEQETLNVVGWSLFYPEKEIKDFKLGSLAGFQATPPNPETPFARVDIENIRTNLRAFRQLYAGCSADGTGVGFDDWLVSANQQGLANNLAAALVRAQAAADAFPAFADATEAQFVAFYDEVKPLSDLLKSSLFGSASPLNLRLPASAASDTD